MAKKTYYNSRYRLLFRDLSQMITSVNKLQKGCAERTENAEHMQQDFFVKWRHGHHLISTSSVDAYLLEEQSFHISSRSDL